MAEGATPAERTTGGKEAPSVPGVRQAAVARTAGYNNAFGPRPGNLSAGPKTGRLYKNIGAQGYRAPNQRAMAERREARIDREEARPKPPFRERGIGAAFSPKNAPPGTPRVNIRGG